MILLNLSHPLTTTQKQAIEQTKNRPITHLIEQMTHLDQAKPFAPQIRAIIDRLPLDSAEWQSQRILIVPPGHAPATAVLLAHLHGRMGYFPEIIRIRPSDGNEPYQLAEIINLQHIRDHARTLRS